MQRSKNGDLFVFPGRTAIAPQLRANPRIGVGAEPLACHVIPDIRAVPVRQIRGGIVQLRAGLRNCRGCHESGNGDGGQQDLGVALRQLPAIRQFD
jgi:hypothetical protein